MGQLTEVIIQFITMKVSWGLPDEVKIELWLWCVGLFTIIGLISAVVKIAFGKIKAIFQ
jgi:hypothetical protein